MQNELKLKIEDCEWWGHGGWTFDKPDRSFDASVYI